MADVWVLGSLNVDVVVRVRRHPASGETVLGRETTTAFGGKGANQAVAAAVAGATVRMVGAVGDDAEGAAYLERLDAFGIDASRVRMVRGARTGRAFIAVDDDGENTIIVSPGANDAVGEQDVGALEDLAAGDVLLMQLEIDQGVVATATRRASGVGARPVLNLAPYGVVPAEILALGAPVVANETEAALLALSGTTVEDLLVTRGADGSEWGDLRIAADVAPSVVDTTGAGDTYCGVLAAALAHGADRAEAMHAASTAAAAAVARAGAQPEPEHAPPSVL